MSEAVKFAEWSVKVLLVSIVVTYSMIFIPMCLDFARLVDSRLAETIACFAPLVLILFMLAFAGLYTLAWITAINEIETRKR